MASLDKNKIISSNPCLWAGSCADAPRQSATAADGQEKRRVPCLFTRENPAKIASMPVEMERYGFRPAMNRR